MSCHTKTLLTSFILLFTTAVFFAGCVNTELKLFSGRKRECFEPTEVGERLTFGTRFVQNTPILPGSFKFKFDLDSLTPGEPLPRALQFRFTHKDRRGGTLFSQAWDVFPRDDGSIPFTTVTLGGVTVKKKESFFFDLTPIDRRLPKSDFVFNWKYKAIDPPPPLSEDPRVISGPAGVVEPVVWFRLQPNENFRESTRTN